MLAVSRGEVPSSEEISVVDSVTVDWVMVPRNWGFNLKSNSINYPDHGHHGDPPSTWKNSHGRAGNRTRDLVVSSQKLWPPDHEAGLYILWVCVCSSTQLEMRVCHLSICGLPGFIIFFSHYLTYGAIFEKRNLLQIHNVCWDVLCNCYLKHFSFQEKLGEIWSKV